MIQPIIIANEAPANGTTTQTTGSMAVQAVGDQAMPANKDNCGCKNRKTMQQMVHMHKAIQLLHLVFIILLIVWLYKAIRRA